MKPASSGRRRAPRSSPARPYSRAFWPIERPAGDLGHSTAEDTDYTDAELEFFRAVERLKSQTGNPFPTLRQLLRIVLELGYTK